jgi:hypothetical protein
VGSGGVASLLGHWLGCLHVPVCDFHLNGDHHKRRDLLVGRLQATAGLQST